MERSDPSNCARQNEQFFTEGVALLSQNNDDAPTVPPESRPSIIGEEAGTPSPRPERLQLTPRIVLVVMLTALTLLGALYLLWELREILRWIAVALFLAVALNPAIDWLEHIRTCQPVSQKRSAIDPFIYSSPS